MLLGYGISLIASLLNSVGLFTIIIKEAAKINLKVSLKLNKNTNKKIMLFIVINLIPIVNIIYNLYLSIDYINSNLREYIMNLKEIGFFEEKQKKEIDKLKDKKVRKIKNEINKSDKKVNNQKIIIDNNYPNNIEKEYKLIRKKNRRN